MLVCPIFQMRREVVFKTDVAEGPVPQKLAVDPDIAVLIDAVELHQHLLSLPVLRRGEGPAIPADARRQRAAGAARRVALRVRPFDAPVVGQVQFAPAGVIEGGLFGARRVALVEPPAKIRRETLFAAVPPPPTRPPRRKKRPGDKRGIPRTRRILKLLFAFGERARPRVQWCRPSPTTFPLGKIAAKGRKRKTDRRWRRSAHARRVCSP